MLPQLAFYSAVANSDCNIGKTWRITHFIDELTRSKSVLKYYCHYLLDSSVWKAQYNILEESILHAELSEEKNMPKSDPIL